MKETNKMPERTILNLIRALLMLPFMVLLALNAVMDSMVTALLLLIQKLFDLVFKFISFCLRGVMMVIGGSFYKELSDMNK